MHIPKQQLQQQRELAVQRYVRYRKKRKQLIGTAIVLCLMLLFFTSIRVSPTVANYVSKVPGLQVIVALLEQDKGIQDIVAHNYYESLGQYATKDGFTVQLQGAIIDEYDVFLAYSISYLQPRTSHNDYTIDVYQGETKLQAPYSWGSMDGLDGEQPLQITEHSLNMALPTPLDLHEPHFTVVFTFDDGPVMTIPFTWTHPIAPAKKTTTPLVIEANGQHIIIDEIRRTPMRLAIDVTLDETNTQQVLALDGLAATLKNGPTRERIHTGFTATGTMREGKVTYFLQSNYFYDSDEITLHIDEIQAVPKGQDFIEVDFTTNEVLYQPPYLQADIRVNDHTVAATIPDMVLKQQLFYSALTEDNEKIYSISSTFSNHDTISIVTEQFEADVTRAKLFVHYIQRPIAQNLDINMPLTN